MMVETKEFSKDGTPETNIISWIRANSHRYVGNYDAACGMVLRQLDDNDSTKYADGSDASEDIAGVNGGDVFMKMPDFWFVGESLDDTNDKYNIHFSAVEQNDGRNWTKWDGNTLIGVYKATCENTGNNTTGKIYSISGKTPTKTVSQINFKNKARNRSNGDDHFMIVTYEAHQVMGLLYMCYYGNMNGQAVIGAGTSSYSKKTGATNVDGMNDTVAENARSINFWGLENWWGDLYEWIDNIRTYNTSGGISILDYNSNVVKIITGCTTDSNEIKEMLLGETLELFPKTFISNDGCNTYYCDYGGIKSFNSYIGSRSRSGNSVNGGPFNLEITNSGSNASTSYGSRLQYHGRVTIV